MSADLAQLAADRYEIADALHRFAFGLDHGDADSLASTLMEDCVLDFRPAIFKSRSATIRPRFMVMCWRNISCRGKVRSRERKTRS